ncbi:hypothetical protein CVIRNUC_002166 [Coccomyxa viridis]|uniref:Prokaryotic-type class I peptide chain release factors domain-containing protein n=1 Tax=Coccomyxa viridis TaxID=1274662 RepID=A0AAV1HUY8_9CHLO|nr:hypothetical protein CVIRNUC_002166 [Coccomyxa viridis]
MIARTLQRTLSGLSRRRSLPDQPNFSLVSAILHEDWQHIRLELLQFSSGRAQAPNLACLHEQTQCFSFSAVRFQPQIRAYQSLISPAARQRLEKASHRHDELCQQLSGEAAGSLGQQELTALNVELGESTALVEAYRALCSLQAELQDLQSLATGPDEDLRQLAAEEQHGLLNQAQQAEEEILGLLIPRDSADEKGVILEVRAGTGGEEAALFASDLFNMYQRFAEQQRWKFEVLEQAGSDTGGFKLASASIAGTGVYGRLKFESGVHRVQRVPATESAGRVHTSAASVAVMPQADEVDVTVRDEDLRIDTYRAGGAGGQHVNTTNSAVRITHLPTGVVVAIQDERSQHRNKDKAMKVLRARIYEAERQRQQVALSSQRQGLIGSGDRSERIRTYNFPQGRVTDHRIGLTEHGMQAMLDGSSLHSFIEALQQHHKQELLAGVK